LSIDIIIPTLCNTIRRHQLLRAIDSVLTQDRVEAMPLVVVNGSVFDPVLLDDLHARPELRVIYIATGGLPAALRAGRDHVSGAFFGFLDDDDLYLPGALAARLKPFADEAVDVVASNGFYRRGEQQLVPFAADMLAFQSNPLVTLLEFNWLPSCGALYRSESVGSDFFDVDAHYREWTLLAFKIALSKRIQFIDDYTFEIADTPESLSKSNAYVAASAPFFDKLLSFDIEPEMRRLLRARRADALHALSGFHLQRNEMWAAWQSHLSSLREWSGATKYFAYTRHLVRATVQSLGRR
jgi:glycosyltransferase involved in cell wall biosynthesis